jgi:hypothetical protein
MTMESAKSGVVRWRAWGAARLRDVFGWLDAHWRWTTFAMWVGLVVYFLAVRWPAIHWFALGDTDDNIRYVQVKDWLAGQGWYDLRQYRLDPPGGANIHWSRLVDLPIAGLMLFFRAFVDGALADRIACALAPLLPLLLLMLSLAFIARRLSPGTPAWIVAALAPLAAQMGLSMYMPLRIDHHGWQLAFMMAMLAGVIDHRRARGGIIAGVASALSITIGMEMMVYLAAAGGLIALRWVFDGAEARRMRPYALTLGGGVALLFVLFASYANRAPVCDALSPVWVSTLGVAAGGMLLLTMLPLAGARFGGWPLRLAAGLVVGAGVAAFAWSVWPQCLTGAYQLSPEMQRLWLANIKEAKPITAQTRAVAIPLLAMPIIGMLTGFAGMWGARRDPARVWAWGAVLALCLIGLGLLFWQLRAGPAAQLLAIPGAAAATWAALAAIWNGRPLVRAAGIVVAVCAGAVLFAYPLYPTLNRSFASLVGAPVTGAGAGSAAGSAAGGGGVPIGNAMIKQRREAIRKANGRCRTLPALEVLDQLPAATIFTMVDMGPRILATTHHSAVAGPYHRNAGAILDIHHAFDGPPSAFRPIARRHNATYLLICPNFPEGTVYQSRSPRGFYAQLMRGFVPSWLRPVPLHTALTLPYQLYRIDYLAPVSKEAAQ